MKKETYTKLSSSGARMRSDDLLRTNNQLHPIHKDAINLTDPTEIRLKNLSEILRIGRCVAGDDAPFIGTRCGDSSPYTWLSYGDFNDSTSAVAAGLSSLGIKHGNSTRIFAYCKISTYTLFLIFAAIKRNNVFVPFYDTFGQDALLHILEEVTPNVVYCDTKSFLEKVLAAPSLKATHILVPFLISTELREMADSRSVILLTVSDLIKIGQGTKNEYLDLSEGDLDDLASILYTSGTSGIPKGVMMTQRQVLFTLLAIFRISVYENNPVDISKLVYYSYLPFQHSLENMSLLLCTFSGGKIGLSQGNIKLIRSDLAELKPTFFVAVPRVLDRFRSVVLQKIENSNFLIRFIFNWTFQRAQERLLVNGEFEPSSLENIVFGKIRGIFGGNLKNILFGGACISRELEIFSRVVFGVHIVHGYGMTESTSAIFIQSPGNGGLGECGGPLAGMEIKLSDVPELDYYSSDNVGEICFRGPNVTVGYFNQPELTKEAFDEDGFFRSGDIGRLNENGSYSIIDRCKNIFKLSQGEYIMTEKIEAIYSRHPIVRQFMLYGDSTKSYLLAVIVVDREDLIAFSRRVTTGGSNGDLLNDKSVKDVLLSELTKLAKDSNLLSYEQIKGFVLSYDEFTTDNQLMTPSMKLRRHKIIQIYCDQLRLLY